MLAQVAWMVAFTTPVAGVVFVLDGILIGAGDGRYLAVAGLVAMICYLPFALLVHYRDAGLVWLWGSYALFILARMITLALRARTSAWIRLGAK